MSGFSKKGNTQVRAQDPKTGKIFYVTTKKGSSLDRMAKRKTRQAEKESKQAFREFKQNLRLAKRAIPIEQRSDVNWSEMRVEEVPAQEEPKPE